MPSSWKRNHGFAGLVDETYIKVKKDWVYLYRAVDSTSAIRSISGSVRPERDAKKACVCVLRTQPDPLQVASHWHPAWQGGILTLLAPYGAMRQDARLYGASKRGDSAASAFAKTLQEATSNDDTHRHPQEISLGFLGLTVNGEALAGLLSMLDEHVHTIGNRLLGVPVKLRQAPAAYHSTELSEMDGPAYLVSLRLVARNTETSLLGSYTSTFLHAQSVSTWQAMNDGGRSSLLPNR